MQRPPSKNQVVQPPQSAQQPAASQREVAEADVLRGRGRQPSGRPKAPPQLPDGPGTRFNFGAFPVMPPARIQAKLMVNEPGDAYEREADEMAERVMGMEEGETVNEKPLLTKTTTTIQREDDNSQEEDVEEDENSADELLMRKAVEGGGYVTSPDFQQQLYATKGKGNPLPEETRTAMERAFNTDFSRVRIHIDNQAVQLNHGIKARAFTYGQDIYFGAGTWSPNTKTGKKLLAHELTHTIQQGPDIKRKEAPVMKPTRAVSAPSSSQEQATAPQKPPAIKQAKKEASLAPEKQIAGTPKQINPETTNAVPTAIPETTSQEKQAPEKQEEIALDSTNAQSLLNSLSKASPSNFIRGIPKSKTLATEIQTREKETLTEQMPEIEQPTGLPTKGEQKKEKQAKTEPVKPKSTTAATPKSGTTKKPTVPDQTSDIKKSAVNIPTPKAKGENDPDFVKGIKQAIASLPTSDTSVDTSAGIRPSVELSGAADRNQNTTKKEATDKEVEDEKSKSDKVVSQDFGEKDIYPNIKQEKMRPGGQLAPLPAAKATEPVTPPSAPPEIYAAFDMQAKEKMDKDVSLELEKNEAEKKKMETANAKERENGDLKIAEETEKAKTEQTTAQRKAKSEVSEQRNNWLKENEQAQGEYSKKSTEQQKESEKQIDDKITETDKEVESKYSEAEKKAEGEQVKTEKEAQAEKDKAEKKEKGFWDSVTDAISDFFDALKKALNTLFDALKKAVKVIIDAAKKAVNTLIDLAKNAIIGMIKAFGEALKGLVNVVFAAFPAIAKKINGYIDKAVDVAVDVVNKVAEGLKKIASAILDAVGAALDFILSAYQAFFNVLLDALEFIAVGMVKIIQGLANLAIGFAEMLPLMDNALIEEFLGTDVSEPLPNIERTEAEIAEHNKATTPVNEELTSGNPDEVSQLQTLANKPAFEDADVVLPEPSPIELDDTLMEEANSMEDNSSFELGGAGQDSVTTQDMQSLIKGDETSDNSTLPTSHAATSEGPQVAPGQNPQNAQEPDWANKTDDEKLDYHIKQMESSMGNPSAEDAKDTTKAAKDPDMPYVAKTNPLGVAKRLEFVGRQMKTGMSIWWSKNQAPIYAAMIGILVVGGVVAFFTGGAGLIALIEVLMQVMTAYFIADAILRIKGFLGDFFSQSWDGHTKEGGKSLAKAIAVLISEFLFEYILKGIGKALQKVKTLIKATKTGAKVFKGINKARAVVSKGVQKVKNVAVKGGKFVLGGLRKGIGKGAKSLRELKNRILKVFRFKRIWMEKHGKFLELWGEFNSKVMLMRQDGTYKTKSLTKKQKSTLWGDKHIGKSFKHADDSVEVVVSDGFARKFKSMSPAEKAKSMATLKKKRFKTRRTEGLKGAERDITLPAEYITDKKKMSAVAKTKTLTPAEKLELDNIAKKHASARKKKTKTNYAEKIGEAATDTHAAKHGLDTVHKGKGAYDLDRVYKKGDTFYVFESKGGKSTLGGKIVDVDGVEHFAQQGTKEYLEKTIKDMLNSKNTKKIEIARQLKEALDNDKIKYMLANQKISKAGKIEKLIVKEFKL